MVSPQTVLSELSSTFHKRAIPAPALGSSLIGQEEMSLVEQVIKSQQLNRFYAKDPSSPPPMARTFEEEACELLGTRYALAVTSGTAALETALGALGVGPGDEVILPAYSWIACFTAIAHLGARPVLAEIDESLCLDPGEIPRLVTPRTKAVLVVHYQGVAADMDAICAQARKCGIRVLEDCAQSFGAMYKGRRVGSMGDIAAYSLQHQKTITSGEGGLVATSDGQLYERAVRMHDLGLMRPLFQQRVQPTQQAFCAGQFRMNELTAAVALAQLRKVDMIRNHCCGLSQILRSRLADLPGICFRHIPDPAGEFAYETFFSLAGGNAVCREILQELEIPCYQKTSTRAHFYSDYCLNRETHSLAASPFRDFSPWPAVGYRPEDFPRTLELMDRFITIPVGMQHTQDDMHYIADVIVHVNDRLQQR